MPREPVPWELFSKQVHMLHDIFRRKLLIFLYFLDFLDHAALLGLVGKR